METIILNKKTKVILWKRIIIAFCIISTLGFLFINCSFKYKYYQILPDGTQSAIGITSSKYIIEDTSIEILRNIREQGHEIADYNYHTIIKKKIVLSWKNTDNADKIKDAIEKSLYAVIYAYQFPYEDNIYILSKDQLKKLPSKYDNVLMKGIFTNYDNLCSQECFDKLLKIIKK